MMGKNEGTSIANLPRWVYILAPFFILLLCLGLINFVPGWLVAVATPPTFSEQSVTEVREARSEATAVPPTAFSAPSATATATETSAPTIVPTPTLPPDMIITLIGPPDNSSFRAVDTVSFYGHWPAELVDDQQMVLYIRLDGEEIPLDVLAEPNMGLAYRWLLNMGDLGETAVAVEWFIRLQSNTTGTILRESEIRTLQILP